MTYARWFNLPALSSLLWAFKSSFSTPLSYHSTSSFPRSTSSCRSLDTLSLLGLSPFISLYFSLLTFYSNLSQFIQVYSLYIFLTMGSTTPRPLQVAIIGGGPGGLGSAIALSKLHNVSVELFEKATVLREIGAGINIGFNCWRVLELLGAAEGVKGHLVEKVFHRYVFLVSLESWIWMENGREGKWRPNSKIKKVL